MWPEFLRRSWGAVGFLLLLGCFQQQCGTKALILLLLAAAVHEGGHLLALRLLGAPVREMRISSAGAVLATEDLRLSYPAEIAAVLAGPAANLLAAWLLGNRLGLHTAAGAHWVLGLYNLLPAASLDGGRCLCLLLQWRLGPNIGGRIGAAAGRVCAAGLAAAVLSMMFLTRGSVWLVPPAAALLVAAFRPEKP